MSEDESYIETPPPPPGEGPGDDHGGLLTLIRRTAEQRARQKFEQKAGLRARNRRSNELFELHRRGWRK
jgi:hypothetical protein